MEVSLAVTQETTYTVEIHAGFNYQAWLTAGRVSGTFASLDAILANEAALRQLMLVHDSVDYLSTANVNEDVTKIFNTDLAAKWINNSDYALDKFYAVAGIKTVMDTADKYGYGEWCLMPQVPKMASNTAPYGEASGNVTASDRLPWMAFDDNSSTKWVTSYKDNRQVRIIYKFLHPICIKAFSFVGNIDMPYLPPTDIQIQGSNDGITWENIGEKITSITADADEHYHELNNQEEYLYISALCDSRLHTNSYYYAQLSKLQFYAWAPKGNVPVMTANTAPYGEVSGSAEYSNYKLYYAFDGNENTKYVTTTANGYIQYKFTNPVCVKKFKLSDEATYYVKNGATIKGSNDGSTWETIYTFANKSGNVTNAYYDCSSNNKYFLYYRLTNNSNKDTQIYTLQFYGRSLSVSVPTMTSNTAPFGEASANSVASDYYAWKAFDKSESTLWNAAGITTNGLLTYKFPSPVCIKSAYVSDGSENRLRTYKIQASNDGTNFTDITGVITYNNSSRYIDIDNDGLYLYYRLNVLTAVTNISIHEVQYYGLDYSEKEFEVGTTKKWLYDHGVELETLTKTANAYTDGPNPTVAPTFESNEIVLNTPPGSTCLVGTENVQDLSDYNLLRCFIRWELLGETKNGQMGVTSSKAWSSSVAQVLLTADSMFSNYPQIGLDISNVASGNIVCRTYGQGEQRYTIQELWLE